MKISGEASPPKNLPLRGRGTAAVGGGGRGALWKRAVRNFQPLPPGTPLLSLADASQLRFLWYSCHRQL